ncbi:MAG: hypothetical protein GX678_03835 [Actinomycetales bacterium]|nr:hypothetical protein [Actinomycetales bacterium]
MANAVGTQEVDGRPGETTCVYVGLPHAQALRYIEVILAKRKNDIIIFHAMELTDLYRHLLEPEGGSL